MQLNPARGRKLVIVYRNDPVEDPPVYAAQPREGTETSHCDAHLPRKVLLVYAAQPREGTET